MCTVLLPQGDNPIAVNKYIISYHTATVCTGPALVQNFISYYLLTKNCLHFVFWATQTT